MKYIGPFLRMNSLGKDNIESQLLFFCRESLKHIVLNSRCGITTQMHQLKLKNIPNLDINIFKKNSPLLCIYKKANPKLKIDKESVSWDESTFKKEVTAASNAFMSLSLMEACSYYSRFKDADNKLYALSQVYSQLSVKQLDFFSYNLRNNDGVFIDKKDSSEDESDKVNLEDKGKKFKFSDQALLMAAFYKASNLPDNEDGEAYKAFSLDILDMFLSFKAELYALSLEEINKICFAVNVFYEESKDEKAGTLLMDLCDLLIDKYHDESSEDAVKVEDLCMTYINMDRAFQNLSLLKFRDEGEDAFNRLNSLYDSDRGIFIRSTDQKEVDYSAEEIVLYTLCQLLHSKEQGEGLTSTVTDIYKRQLVNSGIILSWPETPTLDSPERYRSFSMKSEDLLEDHYFRMPTVPTPESSEMAPVFMRNVVYNVKKDSFNQGKSTFDSTKNMPLLYIVQYLLK